MLLGAGASVSSTVPSAWQCIWEWKRKIFLTNNPGLEKQFSELTLLSVQRGIQNWLNQQDGYPALDSPEEYCFFIEKCFPVGRHRRQFFSDMIRNAKPHYGYKLLCLLSEVGIVTSCWTTNFDGLTAKASANYDITAIEVGMDSQDRAFRQPRRGELLCVSLHGDYRYDDLKNTDDELQEQEDALRRALVNELHHATLIVTGYSGRDASLMNTLNEAYSQSGSGALYWCGFGDKISDSVRELLRTARAANRTAYFVSTNGFDDTLSRLTLHCLKNERQEKVRELLKSSNHESTTCDPFLIGDMRCGALLKSNAFEIECPSELFEFGLTDWPEKPWSWLADLSLDQNFVAVPFKGKVLAIGLLDEIKDMFVDRIKGSIERTPVTDSDLTIENGTVNSLMLRALLRVFSHCNTVRTDNRKLIWRSVAYQTKQHAGQNCYIHRAAVVSLRHFGGSNRLVLKPTVAILDKDGKELAIDVTRALKMEILGYEHNAKFNAAMKEWRSVLFHNKGVNEFDWPSNSGSTFRFRIRSAPSFASVGTRKRGNSIEIDDGLRPHIKQVGVEVAEPSLQFSNKQGTAFVSDVHPLRGLSNNQPYDYGLTARGLTPSIRIGVVCPVKESQILVSYLRQADGRHRPNKSEADYLIDYPGFHNAFGLPLEIPNPDDAGWSVCPEPSETIPSLKACLQAANQVTRSIDSLVAANKPNVVIIFVPKRWAHYREYRDKHEQFNLHDFVKAYCIQKGIATQFLEERTIISNQQCRVWWWLALACYAKSMRTPWALTSLDSDAAFVGLGFSVDRYAGSNQQVVLGCSHLYNSQGQGLQFRLSKIENPIMRNRNPHMSYDDARQVGESIRQLFFESQSRLPSRVVIHKQTSYLRDEKKGLLDGLEGIGSIDLLEIHVDSALRYVSSVQKVKNINGKKYKTFDEDNFPVRRGTVIKISNRRALVWCHGVTDSVINGWKYFQGKRHIPSPLIVKRHTGTTDLETIVSELLGLSKMDWNSADMYSKLPATIDSSRQIARIGAKLQRFGPVSYDYRLFM
ncbi:MAG: hypothetical protein BA863_04920 [Desulfovibrio sp. S3730MH75]|nr:MAG: hypothetical protein BA863_04920 [Desulfovibrio sp. S3730MH75]